MNTIDINQILGNIVSAIQPIAKSTKINLKYSENESNIAISLPLDEVITPIISLILKLLYIIPEGRTLNISTFIRYDSENNNSFLRIEIKTEQLSFNPNLIIQMTNNRFKIENNADKQSVIYMEWVVDMPSYNALNFDKNQSMGLAYDGNKGSMDSKIINQGVIQRFQDFGNSAFIKDKLKAAKSKKEVEFLEKVQEVIFKNINNIHFHSENLEREMGISKAQMFRKLKELTGYSTSNYIRHIRLFKAAELLETTDMPIGSIADKVGFNDLSYFSSSFMKDLHISPSEWRKTYKK
jgi:AraC-like DNA-binding protein